MDPLRTGGKTNFPNFGSLRDGQEPRQQAPAGNSGNSPQEQPLGPAATYTPSNEAAAGLGGGPLVGPGGTEGLGTLFEMLGKIGLERRLEMGSFGSSDGFSEGLGKTPGT